MGRLVWEGGLRDANDCTRFYSAQNNKTSDQEKDYDHVLHALSLPDDFQEGPEFANVVRR